MNQWSIDRQSNSNGTEPSWSLAESQSLRCQCYCASASVRSQCNGQVVPPKRSSSMMPEYSCAFIGLLACRLSLALAMRFKAAECGSLRASSGDHRSDHACVRRRDLVRRESGRHASDVCSNWSHILTHYSCQCSKSNITNRQAGCFRAELYFQQYGK
jgi:hypothetical protein